MAERTSIPSALLVNPYLPQMRLIEVIVTENFVVTNRRRATATAWINRKRLSALFWLRSFRHRCSGNGYLDGKLLQWGCGEAEYPRHFGGV